MRYWFDTEFIEDGKTITLLSIGIVAEDDRELYLENKAADLRKANTFVKQFVLPQLHFPSCDCSKEEGCPARNPLQMRRAVQKFCSGDKPEFWAYFGAYDWVALCQLFGRMIDLPNGWPMYVNDVKQLANARGDPRLPALGKDEHHALADARWTRESWRFLQTL